MVFIRGEQTQDRRQHSVHTGR